MDKNIDWYIDKKVKRTIDSLEKHNIEAFYVNNEEELRKKIDEMIPKGAVVTNGDSITLLEAGVIDMLRSGDYTYLDKHKEGITSEEKKNIYEKSFTAHTYLSSTNALTENGELYNIDGNGSRVAAMIYGPKQVIIVAGINKIVRNLEEAEKRVRNYVAPLDAKKLGKNTPCTKVGYCVDCKSPERICNYFTVITGQFKKRIKVIIVNKNLGY